MEGLERIGTSFFADLLERAIDDRLGHTFFAMHHDGVNELRDDEVTKLGVW